MATSKRRSPTNKRRSRPAPRPSPPKTTKLSPEQEKEVLKLHHLDFGTRRIARKVGTTRKKVRQVLASQGLLANPDRATRTLTHNKPPSKLDPFRQAIAQKARLGLTTSRILREIKALGYLGERSILADYIRSLGVAPEPKTKVKRRFETPPGEELQVDWSPYRVIIGDVSRVVHAFGAILAHCRKAHVRFYLDERQSTLLEAHVHAFDDFGGVAQRVVYDWMTTIVLGTIGADKKPLWHPRFLEFSRYYGFSPYLCRVFHPDRKGKDERFFWYLERDLVRGQSFESLDDLNAKARLWLDEVANRRVHGTTGCIPDEAFERERPFLIALPDKPFMAATSEMRCAGEDSVISVRGTDYTIPASLANQDVAVRLYAEHFEVLDHTGQVAFSRAYVEDRDKGKLQIVPEHYDQVPRHSPAHGNTPARRIEEAFRSRFPDLGELVSGIALHMKSLSHIHLRALWRLADHYGEKHFHEAASRAMAFKRFDAHAVRRILERDYPLPPVEPRSALGATARVLMELGEVDSGSLDDYAYLDSVDPDEHNNQDTHVPTTSRRRS
jgi:transposase